MENIIIVGAGGLGKEVAEIFRGNDGVNLLGFADDAVREGKVVGGLHVLGTPEEVLETHPHARFAVAVGDNKTRMKLVERLKELGVVFANAVHPSAVVPKGVKEMRGSGVIIGAGAVITSEVSIGQFTHIDAGCVISHDCVIGDFTRLNPRVSVCGNCVIGDEVLIGAGAVIRNGVRIGNKAMIGMGSVVVGDIGEGVSVFGVPAREVKGK